MGNRDHNGSAFIDPAWRDMELSLYSRVMMTINSFLKSYSKNSTAKPFFNIGFHGDQHLLKLVDFILKEKECHYFIETGTFVGSTLAYVGRSYPNVFCLSCEPDRASFKEAKNNCMDLSNIKIMNKGSKTFLKYIKSNFKNIFDKPVLFWLDAHGQGFKWPLKDEISFITRNFRTAYIMIDDFKVPTLDCFRFDSYDGQICSFDYIKESLETHDYCLYYPAYTDLTSEHHPLVGWGLIVIGDAEFTTPANLQHRTLKVG